MADEDRNTFAARKEWQTYLALQRADQQTLEDLARLIAVSHVLESLCGVLAAYIEKDLLASAVHLSAHVRPFGNHI
jgi:hypothetical protein